MVFTYHLISYLHPQPHHLLSTTISTWPIADYCHFSWTHTFYTSISSLKYNIVCNRFQHNEDCISIGLPPRRYGVCSLYGPQVRVSFRISDASLFVMYHLDCARNGLSHERTSTMRARRFEWICVEWFFEFRCKRWCNDVQYTVMLAAGSKSILVSNGSRASSGTELAQVGYGILFDREFDLNV